MYPFGCNLYRWPANRSFRRAVDAQDVDINLIRECNDMLERDLEKYEEMVRHWSGHLRLFSMRILNRR